MKPLEYLLTLEIPQIEARKSFFEACLIREPLYSRRYDILTLVEYCDLAISKKIDGSKDSYNPPKDKS